MKTKITIALLCLVSIQFNLLSQGCKQEIIGAWRCVGSVHGGVRAQIKNTYFVKYISKTSFSWISSSMDTKIIRSAMGGTCSYDGQTYIESIAYIGPDMTRFLGKKHVFKVDIKGNKMHLSGKMSDKVYIEEDWVRIDPQP